MAGTGHHLSGCEETRFAFNVNNVEAEVVAKHIHNLLCFVQAQQAVIHEHAGQTVANGAMQQHCRHGGVNTT